MEVKEPKRKRWCNIELEQPFPIFIQSEIEIGIDNWVSFIYTGIFNGFGVIVKDLAEINALHSMGNFGKGCSSRSRPDIMRNNPKLPKIVSKHEYIQKQKWVEEDNYVDAKSPNASNNELLQEILELHSLLDNISVSDNQEITCNEEISSEKSDIMNISSDEENTTETNQNVENPSEVIFKNDEVNEQALDDLIFPMNSVIVVSNNNLDGDDCLKKLNPKLCIDKSKSDEYLILTLQEAYFLAYGLGCLQILDQQEKILNLKQSWKLFCETENNFVYKYIIYHYYRSKGWIVKPGIKFGGDYLLYKDGQPFYHATYLVLVDTSNICNGNNYDWKTVLGLLRMAGTAAKEVIIAQITDSEPNKSSDLSEDPRRISKYKVSEILLRRWISNQERGNDEDSS